MRYARARIDENRRELTYRIFLTDCLGALCGLKTRYVDLITDQPVETRTADEIISGISDKLTKLGGE